MEPAANDDRVCASRSSVCAEDLRAYVDGGLDAAQRTEVEGFLACNPDLAVQVMAELHLRGRSGARLRRAGSKPAPLSGRIVLGLACAASVVLGWSLAAGLPALTSRSLPTAAAPGYVAEAIMSRQATLLRTAMVSQIETPRLDSAEIRRTMQLSLPSLPAGWRIVDVQVFPSDDGPGVNVLVETPQGRRLSLFAVRANTAVTGAPVTATQDGQYAVFWEVDGSAYVLTGDGSHQQLLGEAVVLSQSSKLGT
jgi:anti-sigma factor RsiW